jgi:RNA polymerase sigma factor (sigma-70 family)
VYAVPKRLGLPSDACDDVFQNVFAIVLRELPGLRDPETLPKWLMTVAHHESYRWIRKAKAARRISEGGGGDGGDLPQIAPEPLDRDLIRLEQRQILVEAIEELGERCRGLLTALFLDRSEPDYREISRRLNIPVGAIGPTRNRCLQKLLALVEDRLK